MKKTILVTFAILFSLVSSDYALETDTHELINEYIAINALNGFSLDSYLKEQLNIEEGIEQLFEKKEVFEWLKIGGRYEDIPNWYTPYLRSGNHFHNPLTDEGYGLWESSIQWSQNPVGTQSPGGHYSWHDVRGYFYNALTSPAKTERDENFAQTFRGLGQLMHLVQDLSVPAHTRDDGHALYNYEKWAKEKDEDGNPNVNISNITPIFFDSASIGAPNFLAPVPVANLFDKNQYEGPNPDITLRSDIGLSEYTNANFFSADTIFKDFPYPSKDSVLLDDIAIPDPRYSSGTVLRKYFNKVSDGDTGYRLATVSFLRGFEDECAPFCSEWFYENAALDGEVYGDYAEKLVPRVVGYSGGLLNYFFRGKLEVELGDGEINITNKSEEAMQDGTFELYYDIENGYRQKIELYSGAEVTALQPDGEQTLAFDYPENISSYVAVYTGYLGNEKCAIVGIVVKPEPYYVYVNITSYTYGNHKCIIWNPATNTYADLEDPITGNPITFPCPTSDISWWMAKTNSVSKGGIYSYTKTGEDGFIGSPPLNGCYEEESANTGCGVFTNTNDSTHFFQIDDESLDYELTVYQVLNARINALSNSYNLEILNDFNGTSCIRTTCDLSSVQSAHFHLAPEDCDSREYTRIWNIVTPIGNIWSNGLQEDYAQETFPGCNCNEREIIKSWSITTSNYCDRVIIQIYVNHAYLRESQNYSYVLGSPYTGSCHPIGGSITLQERIEGIKAACDHYDDANIVDPRAQTSNQAFEAAITEMIHDFYTANGISDYDVDMYASIETDIRK